MYFHQFEYSKIFTVFNILFLFFQYSIDRFSYNSVPNVNMYMESNYKKSINFIKEKRL